MRYFGAHVSASGGLENAIRIAGELGVNTIQLHPSPPQRWNTKPCPEGIEDKFLAAREGSGVEKMFFHGIYLINLANPDPQQNHLSKSSLAHHLDLMHRMKGDGVIFHVGSMKDQPNEALGFEQVAASIDWALAQADNSARLILEVAAGSGSIIGDRLEELATIYELVSRKERVGFGLDSQHLWASGYDLREHLDTVVDDVERIFGLDKVWAVHLNDSKTELASRKDRHENFGQGLIGKEAMTRFLNHPKLKNIPFILETPSLKELETAKEEVNTVKAVLEQ